MDVTSEFDSCVRRAVSSPRRREVVLSPFVLKTNDLYQKIKSKEVWLQWYYDGFIGFHKNLKISVLQTLSGASDNKKLEALRPLSVDERNKISTEFLVFHADLTTEINDLNRVIKNMSTSYENKHHLSIIVSILLDKLYVLSKYFQNMQKENNKYNRNPFKLLTLYRPELENYDLQQLNNPIITPLPIKVIEKYNNNVSSQSQGNVEKYNEESSRLKQKLMATSKSIKNKFSEDLEMAFDTENTVMKISNLMNEFVNMLKIQSEQIQDVSTDAVLVKDHVEDADNELILTIQRSKSYQRNMIILVLGLSFILLFLDWLG